MKLKVFFILINYLYLIKLSYEVESYMIFQIKKIQLYAYNINNNYLDISSEILKLLLSNNIYLSLKVGSSNTQINSFLSFTQSFLSLGPDKCLSNDEMQFNLTNSSTYKFISNFSLSNIDKKNYEKAEYFQETIIYSNYNKDMEIKFENANCFSYIKNDIVECSIFGLDLNKDKSQQNLFQLFLEENKYHLKKSYLTIIFKNNSNILQGNMQINNKNDTNNIDIEGEILLGIPPHEYYKNIFFEEELIEINTQCSRDFLSWIIRFDNVYIEDIKNNSIKYFTFDKITYYDFDQYFGVFFPEINPIYVPNYIFDYYINNYFNKYLNKECFKRGRPLYNKYLTNSIFKRTNIFVYCNKSKIKDKNEFFEEFPSLNLKNIYFKEIFSFKGKELFFENNDFIFFTLLPEFSNNNKFFLGKIFMSKYQFTFNYDTKTIGYYNKNLNYQKNSWNISHNEKENNNNMKFFSNRRKIFILITIIILFFIVLGIGIYYIRKYISYKGKNENQALELSYVKKEDEFIENQIFQK